MPYSIQAIHRISGKSADALYKHQETVPKAITAFLEGESFEDVIRRTAVSLGGDCDALTACLL